MRCPQCASSVPVNFASIKVTGDDFLLLEVRCKHCSAFMVLHVGIQERGPSSTQALQNASSQLSITDDELLTLKDALAKGEGSFGKMFGETRR